MSGPQFPIPIADGDRRWSASIVADVARVLAEHGYPSAQPADLAELEQVLFRFIYGDAS